MRGWPSPVVTPGRYSQVPRWQAAVIALCTAQAEVLTSASGSRMHHRSLSLFKYPWYSYLSHVFIANSKHFYCCSWWLVINRDSKTELGHTVCLLSLTAEFVWTLSFLPIWLEHNAVFKNKMVPRICRTWLLRDVTGFQSPQLQQRSGITMEAKSIS